MIDRRCRIYLLVILFTIILYLAMSDKVIGGEVFTVTAYCSCEKCCGEYADGITASGSKAKWGTIAVDTDLIDMGTLIKIEGFIKTVFRAEDIGGAIKDNHIDIWFPSHKQALKFGNKKLNISFVGKIIIS